jgi:hypothetical protein
MTPAQERYRAYLQSDHWRRVRVRILARAQEHCEWCGYFCGYVEAVLEPWVINDRVAELRELEVEPCGVCGGYCQFRSTEDNSGHVWLEVHHLTYDRLGSEIDDDLVALCCYCHEEVTEREQYRALVRKHLVPSLPRDATHFEVIAAMFERVEWAKR